MPWPKSTDYVEAVQNLRLAMGDEELRGGQLAVNQLGLPMAWSGGVADVYKIHNASTGNTWALKCFTKKIEGQAERYRIHIGPPGAGTLTVPGRLPLLGSGDSRSERVVSGHQDALGGRRDSTQRVRRAVSQPSSHTPAASADLGKDGRPGSDRQTLAIAICSTEMSCWPREAGGSLALRLIDYDGVHVPALAGTRSPELGHPAFQHPQRKSDRVYSVDVDRFSHLVIYTGIHCLTVGREELWERFNNDENLLFRESDFQHPGAVGCVPDAVEITGRRLSSLGRSPGLGL